MRFALVILSILIIFGCSNDRSQNSETKNSIIESTVIVNDKPINLNKKLDTYDSLDLLGYQDLRKLRNEIFARKGLIFKSDDLNDYFKKFDWYEPKFRSTQNALRLMSETDNHNIEYIRQIENKKGYTQSDHYILENYKDNDKIYIHCGDSIIENIYKSFLVKKDSVKFHIYKERLSCGRTQVEGTFVTYKIDLTPLDDNYGYLKKTIIGSSYNIENIEILCDDNFIIKIIRFECCGGEDYYEYYRLTDSKGERLTENEIKSYTQHTI